MFTAKGYAGATMSEIAERAGVSIKTVEAVFGTKAALLEIVVDVAIAGDDEPVAIIDRPIVEQLRDETDPERFVMLYADMVTQISGRLAMLASVVEQAASKHTEIAELWSTMRDNRAFGARHIASLLAVRSAFRSDVDAGRAADILYLFNDPLVYRSLVIERGWSRDAFRDWLASPYHDLLIGTPRSPSRSAS